MTFFTSTGRFKGGLGMSYLDGKNVPGSNSPFTVYLRCPYEHCVTGVDYRELNKYIREYNHGLYKYCDFWNWLGEVCYNGDVHPTGFDALWNYNNANLSRVITIRHT